MSDVRTEKDGSVGVVARADLGHARQQAQDAVKDAEKLRDETIGAEGAQKRGEGEIDRISADVDGVADGAEGIDAPQPHEVDIWGVDTETGVPFPRPGTPPPLPGQGNPLSPGGAGAGGPPGGAQGGAAGTPAGGPNSAGPRMRKLPLPALYPGTRRRSPGALPTVQPALWARGAKAAGGLASKALDRVNQAGRMALGMTGAYVAQYFMRAPGVADRYDQEIARQIAALGMSTQKNVPEFWRVDKRPGWGTRWDKAEGGSTIEFRMQMDYIRSNFQMVGGDVLGMFRELGPFSVLRARGTPGATRWHAISAANRAREYGMSPAESGRHERTFAEYTASRGAQTAESHYLEYSGLRDRSGLFLDDAQGYAKLMANAQGTADSGSALGYTAWMGSLGLGTRGDIGRKLLNGASSSGGDAAHALKLRAVREFLSSERVTESSASGARTVRTRGGFTLGAGADALHLDPSKQWDADLIIESKDPRLLPAYKRMAMRLARERDVLNPTEYAKKVFRKMSGTGAAVVDKVWDDLGALDDVDMLSRTPGKDITWTEGPYHDDQGKDGKKGGAIAAAMDTQQHALGHGMNFLLQSVSRGLTTTADAMRAGASINSAITAGLYQLDDDLLRLGIIEGSLSGTTSGKARAAAFSAALTTRDVVNLHGNVLDVTTSRMPSPKPDVGPDAPTPGEPPRPHPPAADVTPSGAVFPVQGGRLGDDFGAPRYWNGKFDHEHQGLDIFAPEGTPILAPMEGTVIRTRDRDDYEASTTKKGKQAGIFIAVRHPDRTVTEYSHLQSIAAGLKEGDKVSAGQELGAVGRTGIGHKTGSHLHFAVKKQGQAVSPSKWLQVSK